MTQKIILLCAACDKEIDLSKPYGSGERGREICAKCAGKSGASDSTTLEVKALPCEDLALEKRSLEGLTEFTPGEKNELHTRQLIRETHRNFLQIGKLLKKNRDSAYWSTAGRWESFSGYIESLGISKSAGYMMIRVSEVESVGQLTEEEILEIGIAKMGLLVSSGKIEDTETVELAKVCPVRDLKEQLGHKVLTNDPNYSIICPHCGVAIEGAQFVRLKVK